MLGCSHCTYTMDIVGHCGSVVGFGAFCLEGHRFESHSSHHVGTLGKSFTRTCMWRFGVLTPTQYQCSSWECFWKAHAMRSAIEINKYNTIYICFKVYSSGASRTGRTSILLIALDGWACDICVVICYCYLLSAIVISWCVLSDVLMMNAVDHSTTVC